MKILFINAVCGVGSTGRIVADLMQSAKLRGHTVKVVCSTIEPVKGVQPEETITVGSKMDYFVHNALSRLTDHEGLYSKVVTRKMINQISQFNPDIIHLHNLHGHWMNYELLFQYLAKEKKRVVWTLHDCWAFTGHCSHFSTINCEQWKRYCVCCPGLRIYPKCYGKGDVSSNFERKKRSFTSIQDMTIVTPSEWLAKTVRESFLGEYRVISIPNGVDLDVFKPRDSTFKRKNAITGKYIILGVANVWSDRKGLTDFLKLRQLLDDSFSIVLVGLSRKQVEDLPVGIIGVQRTANTKELAEIYSAADIFVNASYEETMGLVTVEALACGTPAIVYDKTAVPEVIDQNSGLVITAGDVMKVCKAINTILDNSGKFTGTRKRAEKYEKRMQYEKYMHIYDEMI